MTADVFRDLGFETAPFDRVAGLPHPRWREIEERVGETYRSAREIDDLWREVSRAWLAELADELGYAVLESPSVLLVVPADAADPWVLESVEEARRGALETLGDLVTLALEPLDEGPLLHRVAHLGHYDFGHAYFSSM